MKTKDLKTGVAYVDKVSSRRYSTQHKAVIVSLDRRYAQPSRIMEQSYRTVVEESTGSSAGYLVIEGWIHQSTEVMIQAAKSFTLPTTGETWPYLLTRKSMKREKLPWGRQEKHHEYEDVDLPSGLWVALWLPQAFDHEFESIEDSERRAQDFRMKAVESVSKKRVDKKQRISSLLDGISDLNLEGVSEADVRNNDGKRRDTATVSVKVLEALLKSATARNASTSIPQ